MLPKNIHSVDWAIKAVVWGPRLLVLDGGSIAKSEDGLGRYDRGL